MLQTKTELNTPTIKGNKRNNRTLKCTKNKQQCNEYIHELLDNNYHIADMVHDILTKRWVDPGYVASQTAVLFGYV